MTSFELRKLTFDNLADLWNEFMVEFPTDSSCVEELFRRVYDKDFSCLNCGSTFVKRINDSRILHCYDCKSVQYTLAGTFFHNIRRVRAWAAAIWFMERGIKLSSSQFARLASISESTAQEIFKSISLLLIAFLDENSTLESREFVPVFHRRSRVTPAGQPPEDEEVSFHENCDIVTSFEEQMDYVAKIAAANGLDLDDTQWTIIKLLAKQSLDEDEIVMHTGFDVGAVSAHVMSFFIFGIVERSAGRFILKLPQIQKHFQMSKTGIQLQNEFMHFVSQIFGGISRKYVQNYLGWFWTVVDRMTWTVNSIDAKFFRRGRMSPAESRDYVSPKNVRCPLSFFANIVKPLMISKEPEPAALISI